MAFTAGSSNRRSLRERLREGINIPSFSAKSRSVDQTFHLNNPFADLDIISRVSSSSTASSQSLPSGQSKSKNDDEQQQYAQDPSTMSPQHCSHATAQQQNLLLQQAKTKKQDSISYTVKENDTITSVSASFDMTPSELIKANRLSTRTIFPGQTLRIPPKDRLSTPNNSPVKLANTNTAAVNTSSNKTSATESARKFIKINVKHITDGNGVVSGTLLVTPNAVMFDPNVSDPLVLEQGAETYGVILPLEVVVHAGIYSDIAFMRVKGKDFVPRGPRPDLYPHDSSIAASNKVQPLPPPLPEETSSSTPAPVSAAETNEEPAVAEDLSKPPNQKNFDDPLQQQQQQQPEEILDSGFETGRPSPAIPNDDPLQQQPEESRKQKVLKRLSFPLAWMESLGGQTVKEETQSAPPESKINYRSLVSLDDMPDLFASFDKLMPKQVGSRETEDPPWYLCLTMGKPRNRKLRSLIVSYGQKKSIKPEYWFSIPKTQVEDLYKFWMLWWPHLYGELDPHMVEERGYDLIDWDTDIFDTSPSKDDEKTESDDSTPFDALAHKGEQLGELTKESWEMIKAPYVKFVRSFEYIRSQTLFPEEDPEVVSMSEELRRALYGSEEYMPELIGESEILIEEDIKSIAKNLTARAEGYPWLLAFSTSRDGFSLNSLYRKMQGIESPVLILVQDTKQRVFGALVSCALHVSDHFYGTGQSFLFTCRPDFHVFKWTGENMYFIKGNYESLSIGAGDGKFGLWLDGDLFVGRTEECSTYGNTPLVEENDFVIKTLECWIFGRDTP